MHVPDGRLHQVSRSDISGASDQPVTEVVADLRSSTSHALPTSPISIVYPHSLATRVAPLSESPTVHSNLWSWWLKTRSVRPVGLRYPERDKHDVR